MKELAAKVQVVINTMETLNMPPTYDNVNHVYGMYRLLMDIRDELAAMPAEKTEEVEENG